MKLPPFPKRDTAGNAPAVPYIVAAVARDILRRRRALGITRSKLASLSGIPQGTLSKLESGGHLATPATVERIDRAFKKVAQDKARGTGKASKAKGR